eukprot:GFYU01000857.1.p1 GENE.GFYU01000857.1~~GFYU01000857.1.p1  ORF type:complete len:588 (-),score=136.21 GFYU01000857.1:170-1933(-)
MFQIRVENGKTQRVKGKDEKEKNPVPLDESHLDSDNVIESRGASSSRAGDEGSSTQLPIPTYAMVAAGRTSISPTYFEDNIKDNPEYSEGGILHGMDQISVYSGNPSVELTTGVLHLYRPREDGVGDPRGLPPAEKRSKLVCVLSVPSYMSGSDFCNWTGSQLKDIQHMRILRNERTPGSYMVLLTFWEQRDADTFFLEFHSKPFTSLESDLCHAVFVADFQFIDSSQLNTSQDPAVDPSTELPTCAVCLERLDISISGVMTILCNHSFHSSCLTQMVEPTCPVCRFCQQPTEETSVCAVCGTKEALWICLICGHVGCGRYHEGHAVDHWKETDHAYSMEVQTQSVWDYVGDGYVHRLIQNKSNGKLVEAGGGGDDDDDDGGPHCAGVGDDLHSEGGKSEAFKTKIECITKEYNYLLTSQLESQRDYWMSKLQFAEEDYSNALIEAKDEVDKSKRETESLELKLSDCEKHRRRLEKQLSKSTADIAEKAKEADFLRQLNNTLLANQKQFQDKLATVENQSSSTIQEKDNEIADLKEQLRDLMFFLEAKDKIEQSPQKSEIQGASVEVGTLKMKSPSERLKEKTSRKR